MDKIIGIDVGGTKIEGIIWDGQKIIRAMQTRTPKHREAFLKAVMGLINELSRTQPAKEIRGIGIGIAGAIDLRRGIVLRSPNMRFLNGFSLGPYLRQRSKKPIAVDNDAKCFLRAESRYGLGRGKKTMAVLTLGTGVGGAVLIDGQILRGRNFTAVELGHMIISKDKKGFLSLEDLISSHGFRRLHVADPILLEEQARRKEKKAREIFHAIGEYLGAGLANIVNIFVPELIVLGGGISKAGEFFLPRALEVMRKYSLASLEKSLPPVRISRLEYAGALGAALLLAKK